MVQLTTHTLMQQQGLRVVQGGQGRPQRDALHRFRGERGGGDRLQGFLFTPNEGCSSFTPVQGDVVYLEPVKRALVGGVLAAKSLVFEVAVQGFGAVRVGWVRVALLALVAPEGEVGGFGGGGWWRWLEAAENRVRVFGAWL